MNGRRIRVRNDNDTAFYFSYLRAAPVNPSSRPLLASTVPLFPIRTSSAATITLPAGFSPATSRYAAFAFQNPNPSAVFRRNAMTL
ncbi:MAG: hypothetical protein FJW20_25020 [Acidimicrobiia bacterium]|nr:hypothetical protein [Acidimicrobiia bacterium]